jgi:hypothetical protein
VINLPAHTSFSSLSAYAKCAKAWQLERQVKVPQSQGWARIGGSAVHTATEQFDRGTAGTPGELFDQAFIDEIRDAYSHDPEIGTWKHSGRASVRWPDKEGELWWWHHGPIFVQRWMDWVKDYSSWRLAILDDEPGVELEFKPMIGGFPVKMFIDRLYVLPGGEVAILDIKTGSWKSDELQLGLYAEGVFQATGIRPRYGAFWYAREGKIPGLVDLSRYTPAYLGHLVAGFYAKVGTGYFAPSPGPLCNSCPVRHACASHGGVEAFKYDPDYKLMTTGVANG